MMVMNGIMKLYQKLLRKYPLGVQAVQTGSLMALGDQITQNVIERRKYENLDFVRTLQFGSIGFFMIGPIVRIWYGILDKHTAGSKGGVAVVKKVVIDQLFFAPVFIGILIGTIGCLQGNDVRRVKMKLKNEYPDVLLNNYKLWPLVQLVNFSFVQLQYQVLVAQSVALFWNVYISYRTNRDVQR